MLNKYQVHVRLGKSGTANVTEDSECLFSLDNSPSNIIEVGIPRGTYILCVNVQRGRQGEGNVLFSASGTSGTSLWCSYHGRRVLFFLNILKILIKI